MEAPNNKPQFTQQDINKIGSPGEHKDSVNDIPYEKRFPSLPKGADKSPYKIRPGQ